MTTRSWTRSWKGTLAIGAALALAPSAQALTLQPSSISFDIAGDGTRAGTIDYLGTSIGVPPAGTVLDGSIGASQDVHVFAITPAASSEAFGSALVSAVSSAGVPRTPSGGGTVPGSQVAVSSVGPVGANTLEYFFGAGLDAPSDALLIAFADLQPTDLVRFGFRRTTGAVDFITDSFVVVPEPETALLMVGGLLLLAGVSERSQRLRSRQLPPPLRRH